MRWHRVRVPLVFLGALLGYQGCLCNYEPMIDHVSVCGDGVAEKGEQCDLMDLKGNTCHDVLPGSVGTLACSATCTFVTGDCNICGDGVRQFGEQCDCGIDSGKLPAGCTDVNGGPRANCSELCQKLAYCGDGVRDTGEECDCGTDAANLPSDCDGINGEGQCLEDCTELWECKVEGYWEECDPLVRHHCCPDTWGQWPICVTLPVEGNPSYCMRECSGTLDCFWSNFCFVQAGNICLPEVCSPVGGWPNTEVNDYCTVSGGGQGWCWPVFSRFETSDTNVGVCVEAGTLVHGDLCPAFGVDDFGIDSVDRSEPVCRLGYCAAADGDSHGRCRQFCDWEAAYAVALYGADPATERLPCPEGSNCFAESFLVPDTGVRSGDLAFCHDTLATDPIGGVSTCSLVTNQLLSDPTSTCADLPGLTHGRCLMATASGGEVAQGSLLGVCGDGEAAAWEVWDLCDSTADGTDLCPPGSACTRPDIFLTPGGPEGLPARCLPYCDTAHFLGDQAHCQELGAMPTDDGTPACQSLSLLHPPDGPNDQMPTRLGLCGF